MISKKVLAGVVVRKEWTPEDIRNLCIDRGLYTKGTKEEYESMLQYVQSHNPFSLDIEYTVARDILDHTDPETNQTIENIMFLIGNKVITRVYENVEELDLTCHCDDDDIAGYEEDVLMYTED